MSRVNKLKKLDNRSKLKRAVLIFLGVISVSLLTVWIAETINVTQQEKSQKYHDAWFSRQTAIVDSLRLSFQGQNKKLDRLQGIEINLEGYRGVPVNEERRNNFEAKLQRLIRKDD